MLHEQHYDVYRGPDESVIGDGRRVSITKGSVVCLEMRGSRGPTPENTPPRLQLAGSLSNIFNEASIATNGPLQNGPRASPSPQQGGPPMPNGKPTSPYNERTNPMSPSAQIAAQTVSSRDPKAAAQAASDMRNVVRRKLTGYVGFANLPNQWHRKSVRKGFNFNVMVVGQCSEVYKRVQDADDQR